MSEQNVVYMHPWKSCVPCLSRHVVCSLHAQIYEDDAALDQTLHLQFDKTILGTVRPVPPRQAALQVKRLPKVILTVFHADDNLQLNRM